MAARSAPVGPGIVAAAKETVANFQHHKAQWLAAAIAYFTMFAIAPLVIVVVQIAGTALGQDRVALNQLHEQLSMSAGRSAASVVQGLVASASRERQSGVLARYEAWGAFLFAALGLVVSVQQAFDTIWEVPAASRGPLTRVWNYVQAFFVVLGIALLLLVSLVVTSALTLATSQLASVSAYFPTMARAADFVASFALITLLFAILFRYLPHCRMQWRNVWRGAAVTSLLFVIGQFLLGWYLGRLGISSTYGALGSLVVFLLWVNYSAQIVLLGAEFTHVYARAGEA
jgi:membrane protein